MSLGLSLNLVSQIKVLTIAEIEIGGLYYSDDPVGGYNTVAQLKWASKCFKKNWTMIHAMPEFLLENKEEFIVLEIIPGSDYKKTIIKYMTTDERMGYSEFDNFAKTFHDPIAEFGVVNAK